MDNTDKILIIKDDSEHQKGESEHITHKSSSGSHHSHHSHHHHHSSKRKSYNKLKDIKRFFKKNKYKISNVAIAVCFALILVVLGVVIDKRSFSDNGTSVSGSSSGFRETESSLQIEIPFFEDNAVLVSIGVDKYINSSPEISAKSYYKDYSALGRLDLGMPVSLWFELKGAPASCSIINAELLISEKKDFSSPLVYSLETDETSVDVYNLKTGKNYFYRFALTFSNGSETCVDGSFKTAHTPRMLNVDGVGNMRDIGGWITSSGKTVRQGLLYRGTELDGLVNSKYTATPEGINTLLTVLGVRTELDLRHESDNPNKINVLGAGVKHNYYGMPMYVNVFTDNGKAAIRRVFSDLADKNNYPVYMHCTHGMDRTGTVCYLLEAVLGVGENDMMRDYQLSVFYHGDLWSLNEMNEFIGMLKSYDGSDIQQKAENFLLSTGVTSAEIESIREIFLEE